MQAVSSRKDGTFLYTETKHKDKKFNTIWSLLDQCDIMNLDTGELSQLIEMTKQQKLEKAILKEHIENFYHIWQNDKGFYLSYLPAPEKPKGRKAVSANTQERLERKIIDFYLNKEKEQSKSNITLRILYPQWINYKSLETNATTYIHRIDWDWKKYYSSDEIIDMDIQTLSKAVLKEWALKKIRSLELTKRQY